MCPILNSELSPDVASNSNTHDNQGGLQVHIITRWEIPVLNLPQFFVLLLILAIRAGFLTFLRGHKYLTKDGKTSFDNGICHFSVRVVRGHNLTIS